MPSKSWKQHKLMEKAAHDKFFADAMKISQKTAREYLEADKKKGLTTEAAFKKLEKDKKDKKPKKKKLASEEWAEACT